MKQVTWNRVFWEFVHSTVRFWTEIQTCWSLSLCYEWNILTGYLDSVSRFLDEIYPIYLNYCAGCSWHLPQLETQYARCPTNTFFLSRWLQISQIARPLILHFYFLRCIFNFKVRSVKNFNLFHNSLTIESKYDLYIQLIIKVFWTKAKSRC